MKRNVLILVLVMMAGMVRANHWEPNSSQFADYMTVTAVLQINGEEQSRTDLEVGVFCGDEVRGSKYAQLAPNGRYYFRLACWGNPNDVFSFRLYDATLDEELDYLTCNATLVYNINGYGGALNPYVLEFTGYDTQTYVLDITGYGDSDGGYYLIAPPIDNVDPAEIDGMTEGEYDLYYMDHSQDSGWINYKAEPFILESGKGYLYAHKTDVTLSFTGVPYNGNGEVVLARTEGVQFSGWNLVGNPFAQVATIDRDCFVMNPDGSEIIASTVRKVNPMQGILVIADTDGETMTFIPENSTDDGSMLVVNVLQGRSPVIDRAIVRFEGNGTLPKAMLNPENTKIYVPEGGTNYAVVSRSVDNATAVNFKAKHSGTYTFNFDLVNLDLDYLHLIDNKTGADVDLLQSPNYSFQAFTTDYAERFKLVYATPTGIDEGDAPFAYYAEGEIRLFEAEEGASLQVVDTKGCLVASREGDAISRVSTSGMASGVYVLRLIKGDDVKVQKIIIK